MYNNVPTSRGVIIFNNDLGLHHNIFITKFDLLYGQI
jgi:hypothetical protein